MSNLENKKQNMFAYENNLKFMSILWIHHEKGVWNPPKNREKKIQNFIDWIIVKKTFTNLRAYLRVS